MHHKAEASGVVGGADCYAETWRMFFTKAASRVVDLGSEVVAEVVRARHEKGVSFLHVGKRVLSERRRLFAFDDFEWLHCGARGLHGLDGKDDGRLAFASEGEFAWIACPYKA